MICKFYADACVLVSNRFFSDLNLNVLLDVGKPRVCLQ